MLNELGLVAPALRGVTDDDLRDLVGDRSYQRGRSFAAQNRVRGVSVGGPLSLAATVVGNGGIYRSDVEFGPGGEVLGGGCTCPIGGDCKHVVAVVLAARRLLQRSGDVGAGSQRLALVPPAPQVPNWERLLRDLLSPQDPDAGYTPLAVLVDLQMRPVPGRPAASPSERPRPALRPLVPGKTGWVRTGVSWGRLEYAGHGGSRLNPRQAEALLRLVHGRSSQYGSYSHYYSQPDWLELESLGAGWAEVLRSCRKAGVRLLSDQRSGREVVLAEEPATVSFDVVRSADEGLTVTPSVRLPDELDAFDADGTTWWTVGAPPTGVVGRCGHDVLLAPFEPVLDVETARVLGHGAIDVPASQAARFLTVAAPALARRFRVASPDRSVEIAEVRPPRLRLEVEHRPGLRLGLSWCFRYAVGATTLDVAVGASEHEAVRDVPAESALLAAVLAVGLPSAAVAAAQFGEAAHVRANCTLDGYAVVEFLDRTLPRIEALDGVDVVVSGDVVTYVESPEPPRVHLALTEGSDGSADTHDWFDLAVDVTVGSEKVPLASLVTALSLGQQHLVLPTGTWFRVDRPELEDLRRLLDEARAMQDDQRGPLRLSPYHADLWAELEALGVVREQSERWALLVKGLSGAATEPVQAPRDLHAELRPYQHEGFEWLTFLRRHGLGGVLADDMGLGKTVQALAMILQERQDAEAGECREPADASSGAPSGPTAPWLVVAPTSVLGAWAGEAARFAPSLSVRVLGETAARRGVPVPDVAAEADVVVTSYAVLRLDAEEFRSVRWAGLILDEAQAVKNSQSITYQCARRLDTAVRFAITGTPMENNLMELWSLLSIAAPGLFASPKAFTEHFRRPIESGAAPQKLDLLRRRIRPVMLRRTKGAVATDLPPKQEQTVRVELPARHRRLYDRGLARERQRVLGLLEDAARNRIAIFRALTALRQLSLHPGLVDPADAGGSCVKIDTLMEMLAPVVAEGHQAIVFSQFTSFLRLVRERLDADGLAYSYLDGRTRNRAQVIDRFRSGTAPVFLVSLKAGGTGLTLTEADYVFLLDPWWNPAVEAQAIDRTHRIGQDKPVNVYRLVAAGTIEEKVVALQERKRELFATVVDEGALAGGGLTPDDIRHLLR